jgi:hypothetical protein
MNGMIRILLERIYGWTSEQQNPIRAELSRPACGRTTHGKPGDRAQITWSVAEEHRR